MLVSPAQEPEQLVDDRLQVQLLGGDAAESPSREIEAHLMAEHRQRAGAGAVALLHAVGEHVFHQVEILAHRLHPDSRSTRDQISAAAAPANRPRIRYIGARNEKGAARAAPSV